MAGGARILRRVAARAARGGHHGGIVAHSVRHGTRALEQRARAVHVARLERAVLKLVDGNQHLRLQLLLTRLASRAARRRFARVAPLFDPDRTLVDQCARYLCSYASR